MFPLMSQPESCHGLAGFSPDHEVAAQHSVTVTASDVRGATATLAVVVTIRDLNEAPSFGSRQLFPCSVNENSNTGAAVGSVQSSATDPDDADVLGYTLSGTGSTLFNVSGTGQITVASGASLDHESTASYTLTLTVQGLRWSHGHSRSHHRHQGRQRIPVHP